MKRRARLTIPCLLLIASGLWACGGGEGTVEFTCSPPAEISVDGAVKGTTPVTLTLDAGTHEITLARAGFETLTRKIEVDAGATLDIDETLCADVNSDAGLAELASLIGVEREAPSSEPIAMRGAPRGGIVLYWPQKQVLLENVGTYRLDAGEGYKGDGYIVFKRGRKVLHREPLKPQYEVVMADIPKPVMDELKNGVSITWGVEYESRRRRPIYTRFQPVRAPKVAKRMAKLEGSKHFKRQDLLVQETLKADVLRDNRLHSDALVRYLAINQRWPNNTYVARGIMAAARGIALEDTPLYAVAAHYGATAGRGRPKGPGVALGSGGGPKEFVDAMPGSGPGRGAETDEKVSRLTAPPLERIGEPGEAVADAGSPAGEVPATEPGAVAAGGVPGEIAGEVAQALEKEAEYNEDEARRFDRRREEIRNAAQSLPEAEEAARVAREAVDSSQEAVRQAEEKLAAAAGTAGEAEAQQEADAAHRAADEAGREARRAEARLDRLAQLAAEEPDGVERDANEARERAEAARAAAQAAREAGEPGEEHPGGASAPMRQAQKVLSSEARGHEAEAARLGAAAERLSNAESALNNAQQAEQTAQEAIQAAQAARLKAEQDMANASNEAEQKAAQDDLEAAQRAENEAHAALEAASKDHSQARAEHEVAQAEVGGMNAQEAKHEAEAAEHRAEEARRAASEARNAAIAARLGDDRIGQLRNQADEAERQAADHEKNAADFDRQAREAEGTMGVVREAAVAEAMARDEAESAEVRLDTVRREAAESGGGDAAEKAVRDAEAAVQAANARLAQATAKLEQARKAEDESHDPGDPVSVDEAKMRAEIERENARAAAAEAERLRAEAQKVAKEKRKDR